MMLYAIYHSFFKEDTIHISPATRAIRSRRRRGSFWLCAATIARARGSTCSSKRCPGGPILGSFVHSLTPPRTAYGPSDAYATNLYDIFSTRSPEQTQNRVVNRTGGGKIADKLLDSLTAPRTAYGPSDVYATNLYDIFSTRSPEQTQNRVVNRTGSGKGVPNSPLRDALETSHLTSATTITASSDGSMRMDPSVKARVRDAMVKSFDYDVSSVILAPDEGREIAYRWEDVRMTIVCHEAKQRWEVEREKSLELGAFRHCWDLLSLLSAEQQRRAGITSIMWQGVQGYCIRLEVALRREIERHCFREVPEIPGMLCGTVCAISFYDSLRKLKAAALRSKKAPTLLDSPSATYQVLSLRQQEVRKKLVVEWSSLFPFLYFPFCTDRSNRCLCFRIVVLVLSYASRLSCNFSVWSGAAAIGSP